MSAIIEADGINFIYKIWFSSNERSSDLLACLFRNKDDKLELRYRFRYYSDDDPWSKSDKKNQYCFMLDGDHDVESAISCCTMLFRDSAARFGYMTTDVIDVNSSDPDVVAKLLLEQPWAHTKSSATIEA